ncbi:ABC transporter ATP-binding protein [Weissella cibaria]|jgi:ABC-type antimicrobial peptide transport system, ATPase component|uniref:ABC transporter n=1 Tax=Weissella cibaria TaxID=137591 RepID=A0A1X4JIF9_9LACO|nr:MULTISPECIES: ABC transporter ATP-binding protein [Weissella]APS27075.1 ABC transporter ATP-binding protein YtrE [Weissella cibaria]APU62472.1 ABC transporter ATP-binding protein YtrE [Weissella cibaria]APU64624.1 ABC transporter ATP-binding protein YtrE [Weissella cibaria]ASS51997.1 ABC transporter ATP-binding protein YtrE [Weissella cibaria]KXU09116.1 ABC transporter, ATP-binding protein [Weissella sp. DD23]
MTLEIKHLTHWYTDRDHKLYEDVNLTFESGRFYAIVGESGSGKTTLLSFLAGLDEPREGDILVDGVSIKEIGLTKFRQKYVSTIFQAYNLLNTMTAFQNVQTALAITGSIHAKDKAYILDQLARVGIDEEKAHKNVQRLSGGEQQRVAIVRALLVDAPIVAADEATGNLDHENSQKIVDLFAELAHEFGKTVILITHDRDVASRADEQLLLQNHVFEPI